MKAQKLVSWKRCWHGKVPRAEHVLIYDSNEDVSFVDTRSPNFAFRWQAAHGARILYYIVIPKLPAARTGWLFSPLPRAA